MNRIVKLSMHHKSFEDWLDFAKKDAIWGRLKYIRSFTNGRNVYFEEIEEMCPKLKHDKVFNKKLSILND